MKDKKSRVIEVATRLFAEQGFDKTSVDNICEAASVSKGLVYHHFNSKDEILQEIFAQTTKGMLEMNKSVTNELPGNQLVKLIESIFSQLEHDKLFFQLNLNLMFQPSTRRLLSHQIKERSAALLDSVKKIFDGIDPDQSIKLSFMFIAEIDGISLDYLSVYENYPLKELKEHLINKYKNI